MSLPIRGSKWTFGVATGRDHSIRIPRGGITQSDYISKSTHLDRCRYTWRDYSIRIPRGGITQPELYGAGSLSLTITLKVPIWTGVATPGGITQSEFHVAGSLSLTIFPQRTHRDPCRYTWRDYSIRIPKSGTTQLEFHGAGSLSLDYML